MEKDRVLKLLYDKCRNGFLELSEGDEAYDELQTLMKPKTMKEERIIEKIHNMCIESLDPENFEKWEKIKKELQSVRKHLKP